VTEYLFYILLVIVAIALIRAIYWLIKVRPIYQALKRSIRGKAERVRELNEELEQANILFRMKRVVKNIEYLPPKMAARAGELSTLIAIGIEELSKLAFPSVRDAEWLQNHDEIYELGEKENGSLGLLQSWVDIVYLWLWRGLRAIIVFNHDKVIAVLFPYPRGNITTLYQLDEGWQKLVDVQQELLDLLHKLPGSAEFLDAREKERVQRKGEKERQEQALASIGGTKERLASTMQYVHLRYSAKSVQVGELPVTAGAENLTLAMIQEYYDSGVRKVEEMEARGVAPAEIIANITDTLIPNLGRLFEEKAKEVAKAEFSAGELKGRIKQLSEEAAREPTIPKPLKKVFRALESEIPVLWSQARWGEFDKLLETTLDEFERGTSYVKEVAAWLEEIASFKARMAGVIAKQARLKESYGIEVAASPDWERTVANFENEALNLWSKADFDELDTYLKSVENPLRQHKLKVSNRLSEADHEAGVTAPLDEDDFQGKLAELAASTDQRPSGLSPRRHQQEPHRELTGKRVPYKTALGVEMEIDESMVEQYKRADEKHHSSS